MGLGSLCSAEEYELSRIFLGFKNFIISGNRAHKHSLYSGFTLPSYVCCVLSDCMYLNTYNLPPAGAAEDSPAGGPESGCQG